MQRYIYSNLYFYVLRFINNMKIYVQMCYRVHKMSLKSHYSKLPLELSNNSKFRIFDSSA